LNNSNRTDPNKIALIRHIKKAATQNDSRLWTKVAKQMSKSNRKQVVVNLSRINRISSSGEILLIPGKVLGGGSIDHTLEIAAESFSEKAQMKIENAGGQCLTIKELIRKNPKGSNVRIIK
jgi:large subunit ribosomal protein L18e